MNSISKKIDQAKALSVTNTGERVSELLSILPIEGLKPVPTRILHNYTGNLLASVMKATGLSRRMASVKCHLLRKDNQFRLCLEVLDEAFERYGLLSTIQLREMLSDIASNNDVKTSDRIAAIRLLMQNEGMLTEKLIVEQNSTNTKRRELIINITGGGAMSIPIEHCKQTLIG